MIGQTDMYIIYFFNFEAIIKYRMNRDEKIVEKEKNREIVTEFQKD